MVDWPSEKNLRKAEKVLKKGKYAATLHPDATPLERFKYELCRAILRYMKDHDLTQRELARRLGVHESRVSEIIYYKIKRVTADRLMTHIEKLYKDVSFKHVA